MPVRNAKKKYCGWARIVTCAGHALTIDEVREPEPSGEDDDFSNRVLCSDGACIGVIDEKGICKVCGKPYVPDSE